MPPADQHFDAEAAANATGLQSPAPDNRMLLRLLLALLGGNFLAGTILRATNSADVEAGLIAVVIGFLLAQAILVTVWSGLFGVDSLRSLCESTLLSVLLGLAFLLPYHGLRFDELQPLWSLPFFVFLGTIPFWLLRQYRGWAALPDGSQSTYHRAVGIEDLLWLTAVVASVMMLSRAGVILFLDSQTYDPLAANNAWTTQLTATAVLAFVLAPFAFVAARFGLAERAADSLRALATVAALLSAGWIVICSISRLPPVNFLVGLLLIGSYTATLFAASRVLIAVGYRLVMPIEPANQGTSSDLKHLSAKDAHDLVNSPVARQAAPASPSRQVGRILGSGLVLSALAASYLSFRVTADTRLQIRLNYEIETTADRTGGSVSMADDQKTILSVSIPEANDELVEKLLKLRSLKYIELPKNSISNAQAVKLIAAKSAGHVKLTSGKLDNRMLDSQAKIWSIRSNHVDLSHNNIDLAVVVDLFHGTQIKTLALRGMGIRNEHRPLLEDLDVEFLDLRDNPITDFPSQVKGLAVSSKITLESFKHLRGLQFLVLDGCDISDDVFLEICNSGQLSRLISLSLSNTSLSDAALDLSHFGFLRSLELGEGNFTALVLRQDLPPIRTLRLHDADIQSLAGLQLPQDLILLDLSGSSVDDRLLDNPSLSRARLIDLSGTQISASTIEKLATFGTIEIHFSSTRVSARDLERMGVSAHSRRLYADKQTISDLDKRKLMTKGISVLRSWEAQERKQVPYRL